MYVATSLSVDLTPERVDSSDLIYIYIFVIIIVNNSIFKIVHGYSCEKQAESTCIIG